MPPPAPPGQQGALGSGITFDPTRLLAGNWVGSALVAVIMLVVAGALSVALALLAKPEDFGMDNTLTLVMIILAGTFGADAFFSGEIADEDLEVALSTSTYPLTVTVITLLVGVVAFRQMVRDYPSSLPALGDAVRVALFTAAPLFVGALIFRSDIDELGGGWIAELNDEVSRDDSGTWGASAPGALFTTFALVAFVLAVACVARRGEWWPESARPTVEWVAPAVQGVALMVALLPLCGLVGLGLLAFGPDNDNDFDDLSSDESSAVIAVIAGGLGNGGQMLLGLGSGAEVGASGEIESEDSPVDNESDEEFHRLGWFAGDEGEEPGLWAAPAVLLLVLVACAWWVASRSREVADVLRNLAVWCALLLVAVPMLTRLANLHGGGDLESGPDEATADGYIGLAGGQATFFIFLIAIVVALAVAFARGGLNGEQLRTTLGRFQIDPATGTAPPPPPPPSYPPPPPYDAPTT